MERQAIHMLTANVKSKFIKNILRFTFHKTTNLSKAHETRDSDSIFCSQVV